MIKRYFALIIFLFITPCLYAKSICVLPLPSQVCFTNTTGKPIYIKLDSGQMIKRYPGCAQAQSAVTSSKQPICLGSKAGELHWEKQEDDSLAVEVYEKVTGKQDKQICYQKFSPITNVNLKVGFKDSANMSSDNILCDFKQNSNPPPVEKLQSQSTIYLENYNYKPGRINTCIHYKSPEGHMKKVCIESENNTGTYNPRFNEVRSKTIRLAPGTPINLEAQAVTYKEGCNSFKKNCDENTYSRQSSWLMPDVNVKFCVALAKDTGIYVLLFNQKEDCTQYFQ